MHRTQTLVALVGVAAALLTAGCQPHLFRAETVLHADGSISRAIYQPADATTPEAQQSGVWAGSTYAPRLEPDKWPDEISALATVARDGDHPYFAGWGDFASTARLPAAYVQKAPAELPDGKLIVEYERDDFGLVVRHRWQETLTDIVTLDDMHLARRELADLLVPLVREVLDEALGDEYETTWINDWLNQTARPWFFEVTDVVFAGGGRREKLEETLALDMAPICARHGLVITDYRGKLLESEQLSRAVEAYATGVLRANLRRRDGRPVPDDVVAAILEWIGLRERLDNAEERYRPYDAAAEKVVVRKFGSTEAFGEAVQPLIARLLGLYAGDFGSPSHHFHYTHTMPGLIVKTNGTLLSDREVRWTFHGGDAYPSGFTMNCESLDAQAELEEKLLGRRLLADRDAMLKYVEIAGSNDTVAAALKECVAKQNLAPFREAHDRAAAASATDLAFDAMAKLLELPDLPAP